MRYLFLLLMGFSIPVFASEAEKPPEQAGPKVYEETYEKVAARVAGVEAKIMAKEANIQSLLLEKKSVRDAERLKNVVKDLNAEHAELRELAKELDQQKNLLKYRYPDKGMSGKRDYKRTEVRSLDEMEKRNDLAIAIDKTLQRVRSKYPGFQEINPSSKKETGAKEVSDPVILKK